MLHRYPHIGKIVINTETNNSNGIPTITPQEIEVIGRFEPSNQSKALDYSAKYYCKLNSFKPFEIDGKTFVYSGKQFKITQHHNFQTHCEIWLE